MKKMAGEYVIRDIDRKLLMVAKTLPDILPSDYHDRAVNPKSISKAEWIKIENKLTSLAESSGVVYVWSDILVNDKVFLNCMQQNRSEQCRRTCRFIILCLTRKGSAGRRCLLLQGNEPVFADFSDKWGNFRAVFIPYTSPGGKKYLACAEYTIDYVKESAEKKSAHFNAHCPQFFYSISSCIFCVHKKL